MRKHYIRSIYIEDNEKFFYFYVFPLSLSLFLFRNPKMSKNQFKLDLLSPTKLLHYKFIYFDDDDENNFKLKKKKLFFLQQQQQKHFRNV